MKKAAFLFLNLFFVFIISINSLSAQSVLLTSDNIDSIFGNKTEVQFKFSITSKSEISKLTRIISIDNVKANEVYAFANKKEFARFLQLGYIYQIVNSEVNDIDLNMLDHLNSKAILAWDFYPTYSVYDSLMTRFQTNYPNLCRSFSIKTLASGRKLLFVKISDNPDVTENEPRFLYTSSIHGNELTGSILLLRLIDYLLSNYGTNTRITNIVNNMEIWINPLANPDGTYKGGNSTVSGATRENANNIDMNRNYPDPQDGQHPDGHAWQPETIAFMALADSIQFTMSANFHGGAEVVNYPWDTWDTLSHKHADQKWWNYLSREYADTVHVNSVAGYLNDLDNGVTNGYAWYTITGGRQDYMNYFKHCREVTVEISNTMTPPATQLNNFWNYNYRSLLNYLEQCRYGINGIVTDSVTGLPLKAKVFIQGHDIDSSHVYSILPLGNYFRPIYAGIYNLTFSAPGYYSKTVSVTAVNKASVVKNVQLVSTTSGIESINNDNAFTIFPNPAQNILSLNFNNQYLSNAIVQIADIQGRILYKSQIQANNEILTIPLSKFSKGIYFIRLMNDNRLNSVKRFVIN